jgi:hypothetical protein
MNKMIDSSMFIPFICGGSFQAADKRKNAQMVFICEDQLSSAAKKVCCAIMRARTHFSHYETDRHRHRTNHCARADDAALRAMERA